MTTTNEARAVNPRERLAEVRADMARRAEEAQRAKELAEIERYELLTRFEVELAGKEGIDFAIVDVTDVGAGFVVLKLGPNALWKAFSASRMGEMDQDAFVLPCIVHPERDKYRRIVSERAFVGDRCANALAGLYGVRAKEEAGK